MVADSRQMTVMRREQRPRQVEKSAVLQGDTGFGQCLGGEGNEGRHLSQRKLFRGQSEHNIGQGMLMRNGRQ